MVSEVTTSSSPSSAPRSADISAITSSSPSIPADISAITSSSAETLFPSPSILTDTPSTGIVWAKGASATDAASWVTPSDAVKANEFTKSLKAAMVAALTPS